jgi:hypothetical protein
MQVVPFVREPKRSRLKPAKSSAEKKGQEQTHKPAAAPRSGRTKFSGNGRA